MKRSLALVVSLVMVISMILCVNMSVVVTARENSGWEDVAEADFPICAGMTAGTDYTIQYEDSDGVLQDATEYGPAIIRDATASGDINNTGKKNIRSAQVDGITSFIVTFNDMKKIDYLNYISGSGHDKTRFAISYKADGSDEWTQIIEKKAELANMYILPSTITAKQMKIVNNTSGTSAKYGKFDFGPYDISWGKSATDTAKYTKENITYGVIRYLQAFSYETTMASDITSYGFYFVNADGEIVNSTYYISKDGTIDFTQYGGIYGDLTDIPESNFDNIYYAKAFVVVNGETNFSPAISAKVELDGYAVTYSVTDGGEATIKTADDTVINTGDIVANGTQVVITPKEYIGHKLSYVKVNGVDIKDDNSEKMTFTVDKASTIEISFETITPTNNVTALSFDYHTYLNRIAGSNGVIKFDNKTLDSTQNSPVFALGKMDVTGLSKIAYTYATSTNGGATVNFVALDEYTTDANTIKAATPMAQTTTENTASYSTFTTTEAEVTNPLEGEKYIYLYLNKSGWCGNYKTIDMTFATK